MSAAGTRIVGGLCALMCGSKANNNMHRDSRRVAIRAPCHTPRGRLLKCWRCLSEIPQALRATTSANGDFASASEGKQPTNVVAQQGQRLPTSTSRGSKNERHSLSDAKSGSMAEDIDASSMEVASHDTCLVLQLVKRALPEDRGRLTGQWIDRCQGQR